MSGGIPFRKDVEGLRAIAILLVVAAHAHVPGLTGGFVGVDVFFVLSGYLITGLLARELEHTGRIGFAAFYARRFRRLMPALLLMVGVTCLVALPLITATEQVALAATVAASVAWVSNLYFAFASVDYFAPAAESNLLLHTWSLGVEEQFYLVWPLLMVVAAQFGRLRQAMVALLVLSLAACLWLSWTAPTAAFYLMPTRAWQFALGGLLALYGARAPAWAGWAGLAAIVGAGVVLSPAMTYPGALAIIPAAGAALVLAARGPGLLSTQPMQAIGRVSYAWYLWHWPVLLLGDRVFFGMEAAPRSAMLVALSLGLAVVTYRIFEAPIRRMPALVARPRIAVTAAVTVIALAAGAAISWRTGVEEQLAGDGKAKALMARLGPPAIYDMGCDGYHKTAAVKLCSFGDPKAEHVAVLIGDSVGLQWFPAAAAAFDRPGWRLIAVTKSACPMVDEPYFYSRINARYTVCEEWRNDALAQVAALNPDLVMIGSTYGYDFSEQQWVDGTRRVLAKISPAAKRVALLRSTPIVRFDGPACVGDGRECHAPLGDPKSDQVFAWISRAAADFPNVSEVDLDSVVCPGGQCSAERDGLMVFRDSQHLTVEYTKAMAPTFGARVGM